jgi:hypothetical protein
MIFCTLLGQAGKAGNVGIAGKALTFSAIW